MAPTSLMPLFAQLQSRFPRWPNYTTEEENTGMVVEICNPEGCLWHSALFVILYISLANWRGERQPRNALCWPMGLITLSQLVTASLLSGTPSYKHCTATRINTTEASESAINIQGYSDKSQYLTAVAPEAPGSFRFVRNPRTNSKYLTFGFYSASKISSEATSEATPKLWLFPGVTW